MSEEVPVLEALWLAGHEGPFTVHKERLKHKFYVLDNANDSVVSTPSNAIANVICDYFNVKDSHAN